MKPTAAATPTTRRRDGAWRAAARGATPVDGTAIALIILQLPYALVPIYQR